MAIVHRSHPSPRTTAPPLPPHVLARVYTNHIIDIFGSARYPYPAPRSLWQSSLPSYIAYILSASGLPTEVGMSAMVLLFRYKDAMPGSVAYGEDAARLWVAAYVVAAKVVSDVDVDLEMRRRGVDCGGGGAGGQGIAHIPRRGMDFWCHVALQRFSVDELRRMELELCRILHWDVQVSNAAFECFRRMVYRECRVDMNDGAEEGEPEDEGEDEEERHNEPHVHFLIRPRERVERPPPPPYYESENDVRVDETTSSTDGQITHTGSSSPTPPPRRRSTHTRILRPRPCPPPQARTRTLDSSAPYGNALAGSEDRRRFGVIFDETAFPLERIRVRKCEGESERSREREREKEKERSLFKAVRERIGQIVTRRPSLAGSV